MKRAVVIIITLLGLINLNWAQTIDWKKTENWKIYEIQDRQAIKISIDSLTLLRSISIQKDSVLYYLSDAIVWPSTKEVAWMGAYVLTYELAPNQKRKLLVSSYGGFLYDSFAKQYYEIDIARRNAWQAFLIKQLNKE